MDQGAHVYVCGDVKMAEDVYNRLIKIIHEESGTLSLEQAENYVLSLRVSIAKFYFIKLKYPQVWITCHSLIFQGLQSISRRYFRTITSKAIRRRK